MAGGSLRPVPGFRQAPRKVISLAISAGACEDEAPCGPRPPREKKPANFPQRRGLPIEDDNGCIDARKLPPEFQVGKKTERALKEFRAVSGLQVVNADGEAPARGWQKVRKAVTKARGVYALTQGLGSKSHCLIEGPRWTGGEAAEIDADLVQRCTVATRAGQRVHLNFTFKFLHQISGLAPYQDHLKTLDLSSNNIRRIENLDGMKRLRVLKLNACQIGRIQHLDHCASLTELHLQDNDIAEVEGLSCSRSLEYLNLNSNKIVALGRGLAELVKLRELHLDRNQLVNLDGLSSLRALTMLCASSNRLSKVTSLQLRGAGKLDELQLSCNKLQDLSFLINPASKALTLPRLTSLHLSGNLLKKSALANAPELPHMTELDVSGNQIDQLPVSLTSRWPALEILDISANAFAEPDGLKPLEELTTLRELTITGNPAALQEDVSEPPPADDVVKNLLGCLPALQYFDGQKLERPAAQRNLGTTQESAATKPDSNAEDFQGTFRFTETELALAPASDEDHAAQVERREQNERVDRTTSSVVAKSPAKSITPRPLQHRVADEHKVNQWQEQAMKSYAAIEAMVAKTVKESEANLQEMTDFLENAERVLKRERELQAKRPPARRERGIPLALGAEDGKGQDVEAIEPEDRAEAAVDTPKERGSSVSSSGPRLQQRPQRTPRQYCADIEDLRDRTAMMAELDEEITALQTEVPIAEVEEEIVHGEAADEVAVPVQLAEQRLRSVREVRKHLAACQPGPKDKVSRLRLPPPFPPVQEWRTDPVRPIGAAPQARKLVRIRAC